MQEGLSYIKLYSLVDISTTGTIGQFKNVKRTNLLNETLDTEPTWKKSRNQQRNWETVIQIIGLRAQPIYLENSVILLNESLALYDFGADFGPTGTVWTLVFGVEAANAYDSNNIPLQSLVDDFNDVPIISGLNETFSFQKSVFTTRNHMKNVYFEAINHN
jgi:hypothetical protein